MDPRPSDQRYVSLVSVFGLINCQYIYHALIDALNYHTMRINLNAIYYTHVEQSPTNAIYITYYLK